MNAQELSDITHLSIQNMTVKRFREIMSSMDYKSEAELINSIRNYAVLGHSPDEVQTKSERLLAALMSVIFIYEETKVMEEVK